VQRAPEKAQQPSAPPRGGEEELDLPMHLVQEEAWPELGAMGAKPSPKKKGGGKR